MKKVECGQATFYFYAENPTIKEKWIGGISR